MPERPYIPLAPTIAPGALGGFTDMMRRCRDECDEHKRVYYAPAFDPFPFGGVMSADMVGPSFKRALFGALVADIYIRYIQGRSGNSCHVLVRRYTSDGCAIYFQRTGPGGGYDMRAAALAGIPLWLPPAYKVTDDCTMSWLGSRPPVILTNHCGLDGVTKPSAFGADWRSLTLDGHELEQLGYVVL